MKTKDYEVILKGEIALIDEFETDLELRERAIKKAYEIARGFTRLLAPPEVKEKK